MNDGTELERFMKKHPAWFIFDFHPLNLLKPDKKKSGEERGAV
jgi:hypothetical protein